MKFKSYYLIIISTFIFTALNGCGGENEVADFSIANQPHAINAKSLSTVNVLSREVSLEASISVDDETITIVFSDIPFDKNIARHFQFFLNIDNDSTTGFQFNNEAWNKSGVDYLLEDGILFKSTSNDWNWNWDYIDTNTHYFKPDQNSLSITLDKSLLQSLSNNIRVGFMIRDKDWNTTDFYPKASQMALFKINVTPPVDTEAPVLTLQGAKVMELEIYKPFFIPFATAVDNVDGDISYNIKTSGSVNNDVAGMYEITYNVTDKSGNSSSITRIVNVVDRTPQSIVIDGNTDDWSNIAMAAQSSDGIIKVSNDGMILTILINAKNIDANTQIFLDTDNNSNTGLQFWGSEWQVGGVDYMIENGILSHSTNPEAWSWDNNVGNIDFIKNGNIIEAAIPLNLLTNLSDTINIGFINRDKNWNINYLLASDGLASYMLANKDTILPNDIKQNLCDSQGPNNHPILNDSFSQGLVYQGDIYTTTYVATTDLYRLWKNNIMIGEYISAPRLESINGALYFSTRNTYILSWSRTYRRMEGNSAIKITTKPKYGYIKALSYIDNMDFYIKVESQIKPTYSLIMQKPNGSLSTIISRRTESGKPTPKFKSFYRTNKLFYSFNFVDSNVTIDNRAIGVVQNATSDLNILTTCN